jgi:RND family efflux transporter MFP subunit
MKLPLKLLLPLLFLAIGASGVFALYGSRPRAVPRPQERPMPLVRVLSASPQSFDFVVRAHGTVAPRHEGDLVPQVSGPVVWVSAAMASGGFFEEGEPLVRIEPADYEVALESARAAAARSGSEHDRAVKELDRQKRLADRSVASETRFDDASNAERVTAAVLREARARLEQAERDLARTEIRAPYAGRVRQENVDVGQFVTRGSPIGRIYAVDYAEVRLPIPDSELGYLELPLSFRGEQRDDGGPPVSLRARFAGRDHVWRGHVVRTEGEIDPVSRMVHVVVRVEDPYGRGDDPEAAASARPPLAVGLFVEAEIQGRHVEEASLLPRSALREGSAVYVVDGEQRIRRRPVELLRVEGERMVVGGGLQAGDRVLVSPLQAPVDGMRVRVLEDAAGNAGPEEARS